MNPAAFPRRSFLSSMVCCLTGWSLFQTFAHSDEIQVNGTLTCDMVGSEHYEVFDRDTGEIVTLVQAVNPSEGWLVRVVNRPMTHEERRHSRFPAPAVPRVILLHPDGSVCTETLRGNWGVRRMPRRDGLPPLYALSERSPSAT